MNDSKNALSNLTKSRWLRLSASVGLAFGLAVVMLLLPLFAGTTVTVTVPQLSSAPDSVGKANWSLTSSSIEVGLPFGAESVSAVGGITVTKTANFTTYYQGGLVHPSTFQPGEIEYTITATNDTGSNINPPFYITDVIPVGTACSKTDNNGLANWTHNLASCENIGQAQFNMVSGVFTNGTSVTVKFYVKPVGTSLSEVTDDGIYTVTNSTIKLHNPGGSFGGPLTDSTNNVKTTVKAPVWSVSKTAPATVTSVGGPVTYTLSIANRGAYTINPNVGNMAPNTNNSVVTITEWLPAGVVAGTAIGVNLDSAFGADIGTTTNNTNSVTFVITDSKFTLEPGATYSKVFTISYNTLPLTAGYQIVNSMYKVEGGDNVYYPGWGTPVTTTVQGPGYLTVTKNSTTIGNDNPVRPGGKNQVADRITYTIMFTYGSAIDSIMITDVLPVVTNGNNLDFTAYTLANDPSGLLVNYLNNGNVSCTNGVTGTVTPVGSPVGMLYIRSGSGTSGTVCTATIPTQMRSYMPSGLIVQNDFSVLPVVANIVREGTFVYGNSPDFFVENFVNSDSNIEVTKSVFPTVVDPNANTNITYSLIISDIGTMGNGWNTVSIYDDLTPYTWAVYLNAKPGLITVSNAVSAPFTYTNGQTVWDEQGIITRVITAGTNLNDRFFQLKAKVMTTTPIAPGVFCNETLDVNFGAGGQYQSLGNNVACVTVVSPQISVTKVAGWATMPTPVLPGGQVVYTFTVTNTGNVDVKSIVLTDAFASGTSHTPIVITNISPSTLQMSGTANISVATFVYTYNVQAADIDIATAQLRNVVTVSALALVTPALAVPPSAYTVSNVVTVPVFIRDTISMTKIAYTSTNPLRVSDGITLPTWGDMITYTYILTNNSTQRVLPGLIVIDDKFGLGNPVVAAADGITIPALSAVRFTKTVTINDAFILGSNLSSGLAVASPLFVTNTAFMTATFLDSTSYTNTTTATVEITYAARISMTKSVANQAVTKTINGSLDYTLFLTNTGSVTLALPTGLVSDTLMGNTGWLLNGSPVARSAPVSSLAPGASTSIIYSVPVTQGLAYYASLTGTWGSWLTNTAAITVMPMASNQILTDFVLITTTPRITNITSSVTTAITYNPSIQVSKIASPVTATVGTILNYTITVANNGNVDLMGITVTDYLVYSDTATMSETVVTALPFTLTVGAAQTFNYSIIVDTSLPPFDDPLFGFSDGALITNTADITAYFNLNPMYGSVYTVPTRTWNVVTASLQSDLTVNKTATVSGGVSPTTFGSIVTYTYKVVNGSALPITATLYDDKCEGFIQGCLGIPLYAIADNIVLSGTFDTAPITNTQDFTFTALVDDAFVATALRQNPPSTTLFNTAWVNGQVPGGSTVQGNSMTASVVLTWKEDLEFGKIATILDGSGNVLTDATEARVGDVISYTFVITNNGTIGYQDISLTDVTLLGQGAPSACADYVSPPKAILQGYTITPSTVITLPGCAVTVDGNMMAYVKFYGNSMLVNTATVVVTPSLLIRAPQATNILQPTTLTETASVVLTSPAQILLSKAASVMTATVGDLITYTYTITNAGSVGFDFQNNPNGNGAVTLYDNKIGAIPVQDSSLPANGVTTVQATYWVTYSDFNPSAVVSGTLWLTNSAVATGYVAPAFGTAVPSVPDTAEVALVYTVSVDIVKTSDKDVATVLSLGESIVYTLTIVNNSNIPVTVTLSDVYENGAPSQATLPASVWLAANGAMTNVVYNDAVLPAYLNPALLTQTLRNVVTATANDGLGNLNLLVVDNIYTDWDDEILTAVYDLNLEISKSTSTPMVYFNSPTTTARYSYVITNTGKTTQTLVSLLDWYQGYPQSLMTVATNILLPPNTPVTLSADVVISDTYLDYSIGPNMAVVTNTAKAILTSGSLTVPFDSNPVTVTVVYTPSLQVVKSANLAQARVGDTITYTVLVANNGLVSLRDIIFEDRLLGVVNKTSLNMSPGGVPAQFIVTKTITLLDLQNLDLLGTNTITNIANVTGTRGTSDYGFDSNLVTVRIVSGASLTMTKIGSATSVNAPAMVTYTYVITNNGTVDLTDVKLTDDKLFPGGISLPTLVRDGSTTIVTNTMLTLPGVTVTNIAVAKSTIFASAIATASWTVKTNPITTPLTCTVGVAATTPITVGSASAMTATILPTGAATATWNFGDGSAAGTGANVSHTYAATGSYTVTVTAIHSNGATCPAATTQVVVTSRDNTPNLVVTKSTERPQVLLVGTRITYTIRVSNTGNAPANSVVITDALPVEVTLVASSTTAGTITVNGSTIRVEVPILQPQATPVIVTIVVDVNDAGIGKTSIVNTAFVSSLEQTVANSGQVDDQTLPIKKMVNLYLPIILKQPTTGTATPTPVTPVPVTPTATPVTPVPGQPNLQSTIKLPASVSANSPVVVEVVVKNVGGAAVTQGFWVELYINPNDAAGLTTRGGRWDSDENLGTLADPLGKQGIAWFVKASSFGGSLAPGASITLVSSPMSASVPLGYEVDQTTWHGRFVSGTSTLVSYADSFAGSGKNVYIVTESNENDNANTATSFGPLGEAGVDLTRGPFHPAR